MEDRPAWFNVCIVGAVFATILIPATASQGFFSLLLNVICIGMFVARMVIGAREGKFAA